MIKVYRVAILVLLFIILASLTHPSEMGRFIISMVFLTGTVCGILAD